jgi:hypothetical protein
MFLQAKFQQHLHTEYISLLIRYSRACGSFQDFLHRGLLLTIKLRNQVFLLIMLKSSLRKFYGRHHDTWRMNCLPFRSTWVHHSFSGIRVTRSLVLYVCFVDRCLSFLTFSFGHNVVCSSSICGFWLPLWHLQTLLTRIWKVSCFIVTCRESHKFWFVPELRCFYVEVIATKILRSS